MSFRNYVTKRSYVVQKVKRENGKYLKHSRNERPMKETLLYLMVGR